jgi:mRNA-degrading endonuclease toxin of MazEF toxin-antitoxin module
MQRGEIWMVDIQPPANESPGREQIGDRPAVILQHNCTNQSTVVIVPVTKQQDRQNDLGAFLIQPSMENGLQLPSVVLTRQIRAADVRKFRRRVGKLEAANLQRLEREIKNLLNLP